MLCPCVGILFLAIFLSSFILFLSFFDGGGGGRLHLWKICTVYNPPFFATEKSGNFLTELYLFALKLENAIAM